MIIGFGSDSYFEYLKRLRMPQGEGKIVLMGSGELTATMVEVHKTLIRQLAGAQQATFLDTPAGFQLNVDQISSKAVDYFRKNIRHPLAVSSIKSTSDVGDFDSEKAFGTLRNADYILIGPGSPTYAVSQWRHSPIPEIFARCVNDGGSLVAASAAALTVGRFTLPVYEIYKVGQELHWIEGIDILGHFGINLVVIPHWNNAEGGNHDTRFCFMGEPRFEKLISLLPQPTPIFGLDEHTACILNMETDEAEVKGIGSVTLRTGNREISFKSGERFPLKVLRGETADSDWTPLASDFDPATATDGSQPDNFWDRIHLLEADFNGGLDNHDARKATNALLELDRSIWQAQSDLENEEFVTQARDTFRNLIVLLGTELAVSPRDQAECLTPLIEGLLELRQSFRSNRQWTEADAIRNVLHQVNVAVEDNKNGSRWQFVSESGESTER
jgi:cyanophycinase-like exopeptidase